MIKLFFNKLIKWICLILIFLAIYLVGFSILSVITNLLVISRIIFICIATICCLIIIYHLRSKNIPLQREYLETQNTSFLTNVVYILKSKHYIAELLALETLYIPICIYAAVSTNTPILPFVFGTLLLIIISTILFSLVDIVIWLIVYKSWERF